MDRYREIGDLLRSQLDESREAYDRAKLDFKRISGEIPGILPHPDGSRLLENAARVQSAAIQAYVASLRRFNDFLINGTVPKDMEDPRKKPASSESAEDEGSSEEIA